MPTVPLHKSSLTGINNDPNNTNTNTNDDPSSKPTNPFPPLLQTPSGLAILEIQGRINLPPPPNNDDDNEGNPSSKTATSTTETPVGRLEFPFYSPANDANDKKWMTRVYFYVGNHQRLTGQVKELPTPYGVIQRRKGEAEEGREEGEEVLEIVDVVRYRAIFSYRPEPVGRVEARYG